jgi:hypothetical protein
MRVYNASTARRNSLVLRVGTSGLALDSPKPKNEGGGDLAAEHGADELYMPASRRCEMLEDFVTKNIFEELLTDEDGHIDLLETQLDLVTKTG